MPSGPSRDPCVRCPCPCIGRTGTIWGMGAYLGNMKSMNPTVASQVAGFSCAGYREGDNVGRGWDAGTVLLSQQVNKRISGILARNINPRLTEVRIPHVRQVVGVHLGGRVEFRTLASEYRMACSLDEESTWVVNPGKADERCRQISDTVRLGKTRVIVDKDTMTCPIRYAGLNGCHTGRITIHDCVPSSKSCPCIIAKNSDASRGKLNLYRPGVCCSESIPGRCRRRKSQESMSLRNWRWSDAAIGAGR